MVKTLSGSTNLKLSQTLTVGNSFYVVANGNVGIGNTTPANKLAVTGTVNISGNAVISSYNLDNTQLTDGAYFKFNRSASGLHLSEGYPILWSTSIGNSANPVRLVGGRVANLLEQRSGTSAQNFTVYGTYTDASNYERLNLSANSTAAYILAQAAGTGTARSLHLGANNNTSITIYANNDIAFNNGLIFNRLSSNTRIFNGSTIIYQSNSNDLQHRFTSQIGGPLTGTLFRIDTDSYSYDGPLLFLVQNQFANVFVIKSVTGGGNIGIGNSSPTHKLRVEGTSSLAGAVSDITTLAAGNTTITGFINVSSTSVLTGNVAIGTTNTTAYALNVNGSFAATTKSFVINHPTKPDMKLCYGSLEGPENGVYIRGRSKKKTITLPEYWSELVDEDSITVQLTPIGKHQELYVKSVDVEKIMIGGGRTVEYFYTVFAERKDVDKLIVEY